TRHSHRRSTRSSCVVAELPTDVVAPGAHRSVAQHHEAVVPTGADADRASDAGHRLRRRPGRDGRAVTDLSPVVATPRRHGSVRQQGEAVVRARLDVGDTAQGRDSYGAGAVCFRPVAELSVDVGAPGPERSVRLDRETVLATSSDGND